MERRTPGKSEAVERQRAAEMRSVLAQIDPLHHDVAMRVLLGLSRARMNTIAREAGIHVLEAHSIGTVSFALVAAGLPSLQPHAGKVLQLIPKGLSNKEIAAYLQIKCSTAKSYVEELRTIFRVSTRAGLAPYGLLIPRTQAEGSLVPGSVEESARDPSSHRQPILGT